MMSPDPSQPGFHSGSSSSPARGTSEFFFSDPRRVYMPEPGDLRKFLTAMRDPASVAHVVNLGNRFQLHDVLELGCGQNPVSPLFGQGTPSENFTCVDLLQENLDIARDTFSQIFARTGTTVFVDYKQADMRAVPSEFDKRHFSLIVLCECLTHIEPAKRAEFLAMWAGKTDGFIIVDRHAANPKIRQKNPEYLSGPETRDWLQGLGFRCLDLQVRAIEFPNLGQRASEYFFLAMQRAD